MNRKHLSGMIIILLFLSFINLNSNPVIDQDDKAEQNSIENEGVEITNIKPLITPVEPFHTSLQSTSPSIPSQLYPSPPSSTPSPSSPSSPPPSSQSAPPTQIYPSSSSSLSSPSSPSSSSSSPAPPPSSSGSMTPVNFVEANSHGGSWLDSFKDDAGIEWGLTENIDVFIGDTKINITPPHFNLDQNTVAMWHFNEGTGTIASDETTNNNDGSLGGDGLGSDIPTWTTGKLGNALDFDGSDDYVYVSDSDSLDVKYGLIIDAWIYSHSFMGNGKQSGNPIVAKWLTGFDSQYQLGAYTGGSIVFRISNGSSGDSLFIPNVLAVNQWYRIFAAWNGNDMRVYLNGNLVGVKTTNITKLNQNEYTDDHLYIGYDPGGSSPFWHFDGIIDELRICDMAYHPKTNYANLTSKIINLPPNRYWDSLIFDKTVPANTMLNITILNGSDNLPIPMSPIYSVAGEFDISNIDPIKYPSIRLKAEFNSNSTATPKLHYWGVSWNATTAWRDSLFGGLKCSTRNLTYGDGELWLNTTLTEWYKYSGNPIISPSTSGWDDGSVLNSNVIFNGTHYMMWYRGRRAGTSSEIGLATSTDGITWTKYAGNPVITLSTTGWDDGYLKDPFVYYDGSIYHIWYAAQDTSTDRRIGYATSTDGKVWIKYTGNPVLGLGAPGSWESHYVNQPCVLFDGSIFKMWYVGLGSASKYQLGYATSNYGINWAKYSGNPIMTTPIGGYSGICSFYVLPHKNQYLAWYDSGLGAGSRDTYHCTSTDGLNWVNYVNNPVLTRGPVGSWDDYFAVLAKVIFTGKQYHMYYSGSDGSKGQIGLAKSMFDPTGTIISQPITIPNNFDWDTLIINKSEPFNTNLMVTIIDVSTGLPIINFTAIPNSTLSLAGLDANVYPTIKLIATFNSTDRKNTPVLFDWSVNWTFSNKPPVADAGPNQIVFENQPVMFNGTGSTDPDGSIVNWSWDIDADGIFDLFGPYTNFTYNDDSINNVTLMVTDDQGASDTDWMVITVLNLNATIDNVTVSISRASPRTIGYWKHQCNIITPKGNHTGILPEFISGVNSNSSVFNNLSSKYDILDHLEPDYPRNMTQKAKQQLLALWLNVVSGKLGMNTSLNLTSLTTATSVGAAITEIEQIILNASTNRTEMERAKDIADSINNGLGLNSSAILNIFVSDAGSDDINLTIDWGDGTVNTTMMFYNNLPANTSDPYPSQFAGQAPKIGFTIVSHDYSTSGTYFATLKVVDDDGGVTTKMIKIVI